MVRKALWAAIAMSAVVPLGGCATTDSPGESAEGSGASATSSGSGGIGGGAAVDAGADAEIPGSRCTASPAEVKCPYTQQSVPAEAGVLRDVMWQVPLGAPPAKGWPAVLLFQGSFFGPPEMFDATAVSPFGAYYLALTVKGLLDAGYAVLAPAAHANGGLFWDTNVPPWSTDWADAPDNAFMISIFAAISSGKFGPIDPSRLYATGISSGGYMTSRMAVSYPGKFKALAIHSGSYATCSGPACIVPDPLPSDHPPTLFLHGQIDAVVPIATMQAYDARLVSEGKETRVVVDPAAGHQWIAAGPAEVVGWFDAHP